MNILALQSMVTYGHVGHSAAQFPLQTLGHTYWPIPSVYLSNHKGYDTWSGFTPDSDTIFDMAQSLATAGHLGRTDAFLIGYLGNQGAVVAAERIIDLLADVAPNALVVLDPVIGDHHTGLYVPEAVVTGICERLIPRAKVITPNTFELGVLTGSKTICATHSLGVDIVLRSA